MISQDFVDTLRCPMDPERQSRLAATEDSLVCERCRLRFPVREGIPCLVVEEAELPPGCDCLQALPCQQAPGATAPGGRP